VKLTTLAYTTFAVLLVAMLAGSPAQAQFARTWVSSTGGGFACTRAAPCANFQFAHDNTIAGGEINCVDADDFTHFAALTISKSITIDCGGTFGGAAVGNFQIAGIGIVVRLRNLSFQGLASPANGSAAINFINGAALYVENCAIYGYQAGVGQGIQFTPQDGVTASLYVTDSTINNNGRPASGGGIIIQPAGSGSARVSIERTKVEGNTYGIFANGTGSTGQTIVHIKDSVVSNNVFNGISAYTAAGQSTVSITVDHSSSLLNGADGILAQGTPAYVLLGNSTVLSNITGLHSISGGNILSYQNNALTGNATDGATTAMLTVK
jgi:hypothetical protein